VLDRPTIGIHLPGASTVGLAGGAEYASFCREAEALGFDALWVEDRVFHAAHVADSLTLLTWAAASTERMLLGTAVLLLNLRQAPLVARQVSTLHHLSGGRAVLGVSIGGREEEYAALGVPFDRRVGEFREGLAVLRELLEGEPVERAGGRVEVAGATVRPAARVPILIGGGAEAAIRRAGELGDGWIMGPFGGLDGFRHGRELAREGAAKAGRDADSLAMGRLLYVCVDDDRERARDELAAFLRGYYGPRVDVDAIGIFGPASEVAHRLVEQREAGIEHLMLGVPSLDRGQLRRLAEDVVPLVRAAG
jgi:alkanesulfonate monooxygenase SsuD/methylene tetrahydromethanopterin reductase-like flavin-dependent oxidoreductase (luciferase family)